MPNVKIRKDGQEYDVGVIPQSMYDDVEDLKDKTIKHTTITAIIASKAAGAGVYSSDISPSRVVNVMCRFDSDSVANPIYIYCEKGHPTRICYIGYISSSSVSQTETRTYTLDVFYV